MSTRVQNLEGVAQKMVEICVDQGKAPNKVAVHVVVQNKEAMITNTLKRFGCVDENTTMATMFNVFHLWPDNEHRQSDLCQQP